MDQQERLEREQVRLAEAVLDGKPGMAEFQAARIELTKRQDACCFPYPPAKHTATCPTVTHARSFWSSESDPDPLTACGIVGPISDTPTCETCTR